MFLLIFQLFIAQYVEGISDYFQEVIIYTYSKLQNSLRNSS